MWCSCNKKGLAHTNWIVHLELSWFKKSLMDLKRRNPSLSAWNMSMTLSLFFFLFLINLEQLFLALLLWVPLLLLFLQILCLFFSFIFLFIMSFPVFISSLCTQKIHSTVCLPSRQKKKIPWLEHIIDKRKVKKLNFPSLPGLAAHSIVLSASLLSDYSTHPGTSINASCCTATLYTPPCLAWVTLPRPVNISCVHQVIRVGFTAG